MSVQAASIPSGATARSSTFGGVYFSMTVFFIIVALVGFGPRTVATINGDMATPRAIVHVHAVAMGAWLLLLLAQTSLIASDRRRVHQKLGLVSLALVPLLLFVMFQITFGRFGELAASVNAPGSTVTAEFVGRRLAFLLFAQGRALVLFALFVGWALLARKRDLESHKRLMLLATWVVVDAALGRMAWLPGHPGNWNTSAVGYDVLHLYHLLLIAPALLYDFVKHGRVHRVYLVGVALMAAFIVTTHLLWNSAWWQNLAIGFVRGGA